MTTTAPKAVVTRYVEAVAEGDLTTIRASFAEDATWTYPGELPISRTWVGRDTIIEDFLGDVGALLRPETVRIRLVSIHADGDVVFAEWTSDAVTVGGVEYHNRCLGIFEVADGRIVSVREYADTGHTGRVLFPNHVVAV
ncbi:nuclear transport factor 2 family protein [Embleya sp. NPDC020630]|uniref:nuclear transport factor 2 family protein n=1 Tax=Embleya sp. NPDC020630 TaxID=3363979 RepID=UPI0037B7F344